MSSSPPRYSYRDACDAMLVGVGVDQSLGDDSTSPKQMRAGVNSALCDTSALATLLIRKGFISEAEYMAAITEMMNDEVERYERKLSERMGGRPVVLAPHVCTVGGESYSIQPTRTSGN